MTLFKALLATFFFGCASWGASFCAVKVIVTNPAGRPSSSLVKLLDSAGNVVATSMAERGEAQFCDFGFGEHSIDVGGTTCSHVIIPKIRLIFGRTQVFRAYLGDCTLGDVSLIGCTTFFRVTSQDGQQLPGVSVESDSSYPQKQTDDYGRVQITFEDPVRRVVFSRPGFVSRTVELQCPKPAYSETAITLEPVKK